MVRLHQREPVYDKEVQESVVDDPVMVSVSQHNYIDGGGDLSYGLELVLHSIRCVFGGVCDVYTDEKYH